MTGRELRSKVSSLFDVAAQHKSMKNAGSSIISFVVDPRRQSSTAPMPPRFRKVFYENTYQLDPPAKFRPDKVKPIIEKVLEANLEGRKYDPLECANLSKKLSDEIKQRVKQLNFKRYKLVCTVTIGQKHDQSVQMGSQYLWDADRDNFAAASFHNRHIFADGSVYALYYE
ncbi:dynein light chain Tctex-type protein 2B-like [Ostrea edulis]|uniref:dynein light chain Tctex-type protein 2B-like n=1 Tax=Ostrea edulis TaxID=37623 RepID=UPI00209454D9|nr:dynein light chain Tctex-type protein 2B-like [Ostrea edulis]XP_055995518.1 dynein light chain Tctex-type protein 2B-like [Ostrea edulis]